MNHFWKWTIIEFQHLNTRWQQSSPCGSVAPPFKQAVTRPSPSSLAQQFLLPHALSGRVRVWLCARSLFTSFSATVERPQNRIRTRSLSLRNSSFCRRSLSHRGKVGEGIQKELNSKETHQPGGEKGRSYFEVTMEVPGMQVSWKVDDEVGLKL